MIKNRQGECEQTIGESIIFILNLQYLVLYSFYWLVHLADIKSGDLTTVWNN